MTDDWSDPTELPDDLKTPDQRRDEFETTAATPNGVRGEGAETSTDDDSARPNETIPLDGHEDFVERKLLEDIIIARKDARDAIAEAPMYEARGEATTDELNKAVYGRVWALVSLVKSQLTQTETGQEYWTGRNLVDYTINPPRELSADDVLCVSAVDGIPEDMILEQIAPAEKVIESQPSEPRHRTKPRPPAVRHTPDPDPTPDPEETEQLTVQFDGLKDFCRVDPSTRIVWVEDNLGSYGNTTHTNYPTTAAVGRKVSRSAFECVNEYLAEVGLDVEPEDVKENEIDLEGY